jgi:hypothetical protein
MKHAARPLNGGAQRSRDHPQLPITRSAAPQGPWQSQEGARSRGETVLGTHPERQSLSTLWGRHPSHHAPRICGTPRRTQRRQPRASWLCPTTGATMTVRRASHARPSGVRTCAARGACAVAGGARASASGGGGGGRPVDLDGAPPQVSRACPAAARAEPLATVAGPAWALPDSCLGDGPRFAPPSARTALVMVSFTYMRSEADRVLHTSQSLLSMQ